MRYNFPMVVETNDWLGRLCSLRRAVLRRAATAEGLSMVHAEIIDYLGICNRYSNTVLAVTEYLGQTKGSVSQSIAWLEKRNLVLRAQDKKDRRTVRLALTPLGKELLGRLRGAMPAHVPSQAGAEKTLCDILSAWQGETGLSGFGICRTCRHNEKLDGARYRCGLTGEALARTEISQICREHCFSG